MRKPTLRDFFVPFKFLFRKYKNLAVNILPRFYRKIPKLVWGGFAFFGIFMAGLISGFYANDGTESLAYQDLEEESDDLRHLIIGYEELSELYNFQGENMSVIMDISSYSEDFGPVTRAMESGKYFKDKILVQQGKIEEQRIQAGYPD